MESPPSELIKSKRVLQNESLPKETEETFLRNQNQREPRVQDQQDLDEKLTSCNLLKARFLSLENNDNKINIFGFLSPYNILKDYGKSSELDDETKAKNLPFLLNEIDTLITLVERDEKNEPVSSIKDYAGTNNLHPIKNVLSIPITDFQPPRLEHYLTLVEEMSTSSSSQEPKGIAIFCGFGEGRTGTLLAASQVINEFKKLDSESRKQLLNTSRNFTPDTFYGTFTYLRKNFKTTDFVGNIVQNLRKIEQENTQKGVGISVETPAQFESLEILQCMLAISEKLNDTPPISDEQILEFLNDQNFSPEPLEEFFQIDYSSPAEEIILKSVKQFHASFSKASE